MGDVYKHKSIYDSEKGTYWGGNVYHKEQLDLMLSSNDIEGYAWILHDKDINIISGEPKKPHFHFMFKFGGQQRGSWFKRFYSDDMGLIFFEPTQLPANYLRYLTHSRDKDKKAFKFEYDVSELTVFNLDDLKDEEKKTKVKSLTVTDIKNLIVLENKTPSDILLNNDVNGNLHRVVDRLYIEYKNEQFKNKFREMDVTYIHGGHRTGKTRYATDVYGFDGVYKNTGYVYKGWFDDYNYEDVLLLDEFKGQFSIDYLLAILDGQPRMIDCRHKSKRACFTKVILTNNEPLNKLYSEEQNTAPGTWQALMSRIHKVWDRERQISPQPNPFYSKRVLPKQLRIGEAITEEEIIKKFS